MVQTQRKRQAWPYRCSSWLAYILLAVLMTWPLASRLGTHLGGSDPDLFNVFWGNWWVRQALATGQNPYATGYLIYPVGFDLTTFALSPFLALVSIPLNWIASSITTYNLLVWATIVLCCVAMDDLVRYLTGNAWAALVAALVFGFSPCLAAERAAHLNLAMMAWIPWTALLLTRLLREARILDAVLLAAAIGLSFLTRLQVGVLVLAFDGLYVVGLALAERKLWHKAAARRVLLAGLLSSLILVPLVMHIWQVLRQPGGSDILRLGADKSQTDLLAYVVPTPQHPLFGQWTAAIYERFGENASYWEFIGLVPLVLALSAAASGWKKSLPWLLTGGSFFLLALGPELCFNGTVYERIKLPYALAPDWFSALGFEVPNRLNLALVPALSALTGLGCAQMSDRLGRPWLAMLAAPLVLFEYLAVPMRLTAAPSRSAFYEQMAADGEDYAIVDVPLTREAGEVHRYYQTIHHKPIVGGWEWRVPETAFAFVEGNALLGSWRGLEPTNVPLDMALDGLAEANVRYIIIHKDQLGGVPEGMRQLFLMLRPVYEDRTIRVLRVQATSREQIHIARAFGETLALALPTISISANGEMPQLLLSTCWLETEAAGGEAWRVRWTGPDGSLLSEEVAPLAAAASGLRCRDWYSDLAPPVHPGDYRVRVDLLSEGQAVGSWEASQSVQVVQDPAARPVPLMGDGLQVAFGTAIELLGYDLAPGDGLVWVDLYWRSLAPHSAIQASVQLIDPATQEKVAASDGVLADTGQNEGGIVHERRLITTSDVVPGQYSLGIALYDPSSAGGRIKATDVPTGDPWPGNFVVCGTPVLVLPSTSAAAAQEGGRVVVYSSAMTGAASTPQCAVSATFGDVAQLIGYDIQPSQADLGRPLDVTLYWRAISGHDEPTGYTVFVHLLDASGKVIAQHDGQPAGGRRSTPTWRKGDEITDVHAIVWLTQDYEGVATIEVGLYDQQTLERLPAYGPQGARLPDDRAVIGQVQIQSAN